MKNLFKKLKIKREIKKTLKYSGVKNIHIPRSLVDRAYELQTEQRNYSLALSETASEGSFIVGVKIIKQLSSEYEEDFNRYKEDYERWENEVEAETHYAEFSSWSKWSEISSRKPSPPKIPKEQRILVYVSVDVK